MQHGGGPSALFCWAVAQEQTPEPLRIARLTVDLLRPVPVAPMVLESETVRTGRKIRVS